MSTQKGSKPAQPDKKMKILMLHGYTQSGPLFHKKTRALEKLLIKTLAPSSILPELIYPSAPVNLRPQDIPGYVFPEGDDGPDPDAKTDAWAWFRKDDATDTYLHFDEGMSAVSDAIRDAGGIDAILGFSQGAAVAVLVAAALESGREPPAGPAGEWARRLREANSVRDRGVTDLLFAVSYCGFFAPMDSFRWCYDPVIQTPTLHVIGGLDTIVEESRSRGLVDRTRDPLVVVHPGGHHVPVAKEWAMPLLGFVKQHSEEKVGGEQEAE
ncbi:Serine hydrolase (FSH1) [Geosmithia morbida]|uniref:Serine hydrolase (FSH1) n=1 Tax=Geosmithia morbida TaxID=1094350 RepID=A0A9P4YXQ0_9HYPO|nr:Serine hydrolase (FSH1) [Geosmithia morbida]KAF4124422.1 Serine hydrolase (FSH1) [Geosmithia morbida]